MVSQSAAAAAVAPAASEFKQEVPGETEKGEVFLRGVGILLYDFPQNASEQSSFGEVCVCARLPLRSFSNSCWCQGRRLAESSSVNRFSSSLLMLFDAFYFCAHTMIAALSSSARVRGSALAGRSLSGPSAGRSSPRCP